MSQTNTLAQYQTLSSHTELLGCALPTLTAGQIVVTSSICKQTELSKRLAAWLNAKGWYQSASVTGLGMPEQLSDLLEGQWNQGDNSLHLTLLQGDSYQLVEIEKQAEVSSETPAQYYSDQHIWLRPQLKGQHNALRYRLWFEQQQGAWQPIMQQFVGFDLLEDK